MDEERNIDLTLESDLQKKAESNDPILFAKNPNEDDNQLSETEERKPKRRKKFKINGTIALYSLFSLAYGGYLKFVLGNNNGFIWLILGALELIAVFAWARKRILPAILSFVLVVNTVAFGAIMVLGMSRDNNNADYAFVLGYALNNDKSTETLDYRLEKAYDYANRNENTILILCGGITGKNSVSEASVMKDYLIGRGISDSRILVEDRSTNTVENINNAKAIIDGSGISSPKIVVLSSNYHLYRASLICKKCGLNVKTVSAKAPLALIPNQLLFEELGIIVQLLSK